MIDPVCFHLGSKAIYWYGVLSALGFVAAVWHWNRLARRDGRPAGFGSDFAFLVMFSGILGARLAYVLANAPEYAAHPLEILRIDRGGLIFYGGFLGACAAVYVFARRRGEHPLALGDFGVTGLVLGHAFGRLGCLLNGCCYGRPSDVPWHVWTAEAWRHPVQAYEALFNLALFAVLLRLYPRRPREGAVLALYLAAYGAWRFAAEFSPTESFTANYSYTHSELDEQSQALKVFGLTPTASAVAGTTGYPTNVALTSRSRSATLTAIRNNLAFLGPAAATPQVQQLSQWIDRIMFAIEQGRTNALSKLGPPRLAGRQHIIAGSAKQPGKQLQLGRFSAPVNSLKGDQSSTKRHRYRPGCLISLEAGSPDKKSFKQRGLKLLCVVLIDN